MLKKAICISYTNYSNKRIAYVKETLQSLNYEVIFYTADFNHYTKSYYSLEEEGTVQVHVPPYKRNLSVSRIISYCVFARKVYKELKKIKPSLVYDLVPPNAAVKACAEYKRRNKTILIFDVFDLWPETFPYKHNPLLSLPFNIWRSVRDKNISAADEVMYECNLFAEAMKDITKNCVNETVYVSSEDVKADITGELLISNHLNIVYLGSINNIIDIDFIVNLLDKLTKYKAVDFHVIGEGEKRAELIEKAQNIGVNVKYHGKIYDEAQKAQIFSGCDFALNIMQPYVYVGLSMKSVDYFKMGIPVINNIQGDTYEMIDAYGVGFNISEKNIDEVAAKVAKITKDENTAMRRKSRDLYEEFFSPEVFKGKLSEAFKKTER